MLAHELTHALDDQHFDLQRLDELAARCADERFTAALGLVEGSAQHFATAVILADPTLDLSGLADAMDAAAEAQAALRDVPPFVQALQSWPYVDRAGVRGRDRSATAAPRPWTRRCADRPVSTEQVIHPELSRTTPTRR